MICACSCAARRSRPSQPTAAILDNRTLPSTPESGARAGDDGHKRHLLVATERLVLTVTVHPADIIDRDGVKRLLPHDRVDGIRTRFPRLQHVWLDASYNGKNKGKDWSEQALGWSAEIVAHPPRRKEVWAPTYIPPEPIDWSKYG